MGLRSNPSQRQRRLGAELRKLRVTSGLGAGEAGAHVGLGGPHLNHIEAGRTAIAEEKLRALAAVYGCKSATLIDSLVEMNRQPPGAWWRNYRRDLDARALDLADLEASSTRIRSFESVNMPGLLQAPEYVSALLGTRTSDPAATKVFQDFRLARQAVLTRDPAPAYHAIIHEAALHMHFVDSEVLRRQLTHLIEVSRLPHITIQVVPFRAGPLPAVGSPFVMFSNGERTLDTVYMEHDVGAGFLSEEKYLAHYDAMFDRLTELALPPLTLESERTHTSQRDSMSLIQHLLYIL